MRFKPQLACVRSGAKSVKNTISDTFTAFLVRANFQARLHAAQYTGRNLNQ